MPTKRHTPTVRLRRLAAELRRLRASADLTREDVTERTGINAATLYRIETARVRPQQRTLVSLLDIYQVTHPKRELRTAAQLRTHTLERPDSLRAKKKGSSNNTT